jgi:hypothetical protein
MNLNQIGKHQIIDVAKSLSQISLVALTTAVANKALKQSVESAITGINNIRMTIKNS